MPLGKFSGYFSKMISTSYIVLLRSWFAELLRFPFQKCIPPTYHKCTQSHSPPESPAYVTLCCSILSIHRMGIFLALKTKSHALLKDSFLPPINHNLPKYILCSSRILFFSCPVEIIFRVIIFLAHQVFHNWTHQINSNATTCHLLCIQRVIFSSCLFVAW